MPYKLLYYDEAKMDIKEAKDWYKKQRKGLEKEFAAAIKDTIINILVRPSSHTIRYKNVRIAHPDTFPYSIHYYIDDVRHYIVITAIIHDHRDPDISKSR